MIFFSIQYIGSKKTIPKSIAQQKYPKNNESQITFLGSVVAERVYPATRQCFIVFKGKKIEEQQLITIFHYCAITMEPIQHGNLSGETL